MFGKRQQVKLLVALEDCSVLMPPAFVNQKLKPSQDPII